MGLADFGENDSRQTALARGLTAHVLCHLGPTTIAYSAI